MKSIPRHDYRGFALPKPERRKKSVERAAAPESTVQACVDARLAAGRIPYMRLSETLLRTIFASKAIPVHVKKIIADELGGWPDNICFLPISDKYSLCCMVENKTTIGKLHGKQKAVSAMLPVNIVRSDAEGQLLLKEYEKMAALLAQGIREYSERKEGDDGKSE